MGFTTATFKLTGDRESIEGRAIVDSGSLYTVVDEALAEKLGVRYTGLKVALTSSSGHRIVCREALIASVTVEGRTAPYELIALCNIPQSLKEVLRKYEVDERVIIGVHTLERLGYAIDPVTHRLVQSPGTLMIYL